MLIKKNIFFILVVAVVTAFSGCSGGGSKKESKNTTVVLEDENSTLSSLGITTTKELKTKIETVGAVALSVELKNANPKATTEEISALLKKNNDNIEYAKLEQVGVKDSVIVKLKKLPYSPIKVKEAVSLPDTKIFPIKNLSSTAVDLLNQEKLKTLNKNLRLKAQDPISMDEFLELQRAFTKVKIVNNFGKLDQQYQNILARDTNSSGLSSLSASATAEVPDGFVLVNGAKEIKQDAVASQFPFMDNSCQITRPVFPMSIAKTGTSINSTLVISKDGDVEVQIPQTGIAVISVSGDTNQEVILKNAEGVELDRRSLDKSYTYYLPITSDDVCKSFLFEGADSQFNIILTDIIQPERITKHIFLNGEEFLTTRANEVYPQATSFHAKSYSFSTFHSTLNDLNITFGIDTDDETSAYFDYVLYAPGGAVYSDTLGGLVGFLHTDGVSREKGIWRLDVLPKNSVVFATTDTSTKLSEITPVSSFRDGDTSFTLQAYINTDKKVQTKEFVLGVLKSVSLKTEGEDGLLNEGEVTIHLNTSMAPKLNIPSYLDDLIADGDTMNKEVALWQCWENSDKTGHEFDADGACIAYKDEFERRKELYETAHTYDYQNNPETYPCREHEDGICIKGELGPYDVENPSEDTKARKVMIDYSSYMQREYQDVEYLHALSNYYDLYQNWVARTVQVDVGTFPYDSLSYKTLEFMPCESDDQECINNYATSRKLPRMPVVIQTDRPIFGVAVEKVNKSALPISFDYSTSDQDVYNTDATLLPALSYAVSQAVNIATGNFVDLVCKTVTFLDDLHEIERNAEDDPLGSARATINRYSDGDPFYGLHTQNDYHFYMSGVAEKNTNIDTYGQKLNYAQIACSLVDISNSGLQFEHNADSVLNMNNEHLPTEQSVYNILLKNSSDGNTSSIMNEAQEIVSLIYAGNIAEAKKRLKTSSDISNLDNGVDIYSNIESLLNNYKDEGSAQNGNNVLKSDAQYLLGNGKKTRGNVEFSRVSSAPVKNIKVFLNNVKIISNYESDDNAEINLIPFVGVVGDGQKSSSQAHSLFSDTEVIGDASGQGWDYLYFSHVADNEELDTKDAILYEGGAENIAALYIELNIVEDDGVSKEDDDMIGVFSKTIKLEEIFNKNGLNKWTHISGDHYQLKISDYPVYNSRNQLSIENPLSADYEQQHIHNQRRKPSALVSVTVDVYLDESINTPVPPVDTSLKIPTLSSGKDTLSMEMKLVNKLSSNKKFYNIIDVFDKKAIVSANFSDSLPATIVEIDPATATMKELFSYDIEDFNGTLAPIKEALSSSKSIGRRLNSNVNKKELSLVRLLENNRILFVISHDTAAKIMVVHYTDSGEMSLENSLDIKDINDQNVFTTIRSFLSPNRTKLIVPYIPSEYASGDKHEAAQPKLNLYQLTDTNVTLLSHLNIGSQISFEDLDFIDEAHLAVLSQNLIYETESSFREGWKEHQKNCTSEKLDCLFTRKSANLLLFRINDNNRIELTDSLDTDYTVPDSKYFNINAPLKTELYPADKKINLVSLVDEFYANLKLGYKIYKLNYDISTDGYYLGGVQSYSSKNHSLRYNEKGAYYCAHGITCSGYLSSTVKPTQSSENIFQWHDASMRISKFEFMDTDRDLILALVNNGQLALLNLYGGAAYKGPVVSGDIFDTNIRVESTDQISISFTITDRDTPVDDFIIITDISTIEAPSDYNVTQISNIKCVAGENNISQCTGTISIGALTDLNATLNQEISISVSDGTYAETKSFHIYHRPSILLPFTDSTHQVEMWMSDGSSDGTMMLNDANQNGSSLSLGTVLYKFKQKYLYTGTISSDTYEPFVASISEQAHRIDSSKVIGAALNYVTFGESVYFIAVVYDNDNGISTYSLWRTDTTQNGTSMVKDFSNYRSINSLVLFNDKLYFVAEEDSSYSNRYELWVSDGTQQGTKKLVSDLVTSYLFAGAGKLFFNKHDSSDDKNALWSNDGTSNGTTLVKKMDPNTYQMMEYKGDVYFENSYDGNESFDYKEVTELYKTDGTQQGTAMVHRLAVSNSTQHINGYFMCENKIYFFLNSSGELWSSDGSDAGTAKVVDIYTVPDFLQLHRDSIPLSVRVVDGTIYILIRHYDNEQYFKVYMIRPSDSSVLEELDATRYSNIVLYNDVIGKDLLYYGEYEDKNYLYKHNPDDGQRVVKSTTK